MAMGFGNGYYGHERWSSTMYSSRRINSITTMRGYTESKKLAKKQKKNKTKEINCELYLYDIVYPIYIYTRYIHTCNTHLQVHILGQSSMLARSTIHIHTYTTLYTYNNIYFYRRWNNNNNNNNTILKQTKIKVKQLIYLYKSVF